MYHDFAERNEDTLYGTAAIARFLGVPRRKAFYLIERGRIPAGKTRSGKYREQECAAPALGDPHAWGCVQRAPIKTGDR